jgi:fibronectin type 3 domain-containing protein
LTPSTEYCYTVSSVNKTVESFDKSDFACAVTLDIVPAVPANVKVEATSSTSVKVSWDESENAQRYYIYSADTLVAKTSYTYYNIVGLTPDTEYCYTVTAVNGEVESAESETACGKTEPDGITEIASSLNVYPNPVKDRLYIETEV